MRSILRLVILVIAYATSAQAQTYTQLQLGVDKTATPYNVGTLLNSIWYNFATLSNTGVFIIKSTSGGAGLVNGALKGNGAGTVSQASCSDISGVSVANCASNTYELHFKNYGAVGDGATDDTTAINLAFSAARTVVGTSNYSSVKVVCDPGTYLTTGTIDATVLQVYNSTKLISVVGDGCTILGQQNGIPVLDATGSTSVDWGPIKIYGIGAGVGQYPTVGFLLGRIPPDSAHINPDASTTALSNCCTNVDRHTLTNVVIQGFYSVAPFYNFASEQNDIFHAKFVNNHTSTTAYAAVWDGINHFDVFSRFITKTYSAWVTSTVYANGAYVTNAGHIYYAPTGGTSGASAPTCTTGTCSDGTITWYWVHAVDGYAHLPPNYSQPLSNNSCYGCIIQQNSGGPTIWIAGTGNQKFIGGYALNQNSQPIYVLDSTAGSIGNFETTMHAEGGAANISSVFQFQNGGTPLIQGLHYEEVALFIKTSAASVFSIGTGVTSVTIRDLRYRVDIPYTLSTYPIFDTAANYTIQGGDVYTQSSASWSAPAAFSGKLCFSSACRFVGGTYYESVPLNKTASYTLGSEDSNIIFNCAATCTITLPAASTWDGRIVTIKTIAAFTVVSASSNVVPIDSATPGTAILAATAGKWATLKSDGTDWVVMEGN